MPPTLLDGREVSLILLHRGVMRVVGGFKKVMENDTWDEIAFKCGTTQMTHKWLKLLISIIWNWWNGISTS
ncbi:putative transcription factor & chromatin remodeling ARID family [Helianthus anomalus]